MSSDQNYETADEPAGPEPGVQESKKRTLRKWELWGRPVLHHIVGAGAVAALVAGAVTVSIYVVGALGTCQDEARIAVEQGNVALFEGRVQSARTVALAQLDLAPNCGCAHALMAEVLASELQHPAATQAAEERAQMFRDCLVHATRGRAAGESVERMSAIIDYCKAGLATIAT